MEHLETLWKYQEYDLLMDRYENERKNSELRRKLIKLKNYLMEQQDHLVKIDGEVNRKHNLLNKINHEYENILITLKTEKDKIQAGELEDINQLELIEKEGTELKNKVIKKEEELQKLIKDLESFQKKVEIIGHQISKSKKEYAEIKSEYDVEVKKLKALHQKVKVKRDKLIDKIDEVILTKYNNLKPNYSPVIAGIQNDQCGGCNMSLASLVTRNVKDNKQIVECENCGRFLYFNA